MLLFKQFDYLSIQKYRIITNSARITGNCFCSCNSLDASHCIEVLQNAIAMYGTPEIINSDQGCQFTCKAWLEACAQHPQMKVSMDGRGRAKGNIWIERFWKTIIYEYIYLLPEENGTILYSGIKRFIDNYNYHRRHQGINRQVPSKLYIRLAE